MSVKFRVISISEATSMTAGVPSSVQKYTKRCKKPYFFLKNVEKHLKSRTILTKSNVITPTNSTLRMSICRKMMTSNRGNMTIVSIQNRKAKWLRQRMDWFRVKKMPCSRW